jgi:glycosyltransferase involved in cell wall biosynthesis
MKICHLTTVHPSDDVRIFHKECVSLSKHNFDVTLISLGGNSFYDKNIRVIGLNWKYSNNRILRIFIGPFIVLFKCLQVNAKLYHFHDPELIFVGIILRFFRKKVIYDVHEDFFSDFLDREYVKLIQVKHIAWLIRKIEFFLGRYFSAIITATPYINSIFEKVNTNTININNYPILKELENKSEFKFDKEFRLIYAGLISKNRCSLEMIKSLDFKTPLILAGECESIHEMENLIKLEEWKFVDYLGKINRIDLSVAMSNASVGLVLFKPLPNHIFSLPNKLFEYMSAGLPIIASDFQLWRDIIEVNDVGICVNPNDISSIKKAIYSLSCNPERLKIMGFNGQKMVSEKYNWDKESLKLINLYNKILCAE